jgi:hypothetical protein
VLSVTTVDIKYFRIDTFANAPDSAKSKT